MKPELIKKINMYFHDEEADYFADRHTARMKEESDFYKSFFENFSHKNKPGLKILDIGSGTGLVGQALPEKYGRLICTDISAKMIDIARENLGLKNKKMIDFVICDAETLPFKDKVFDIIICNAAMHHFPSTEKFASEVKRVIAPDGSIVLGFESNKRFWSNAALSLLYRLFSKLHRTRGSSDDTGYKKICKTVNEKLLRNGDIISPLSNMEILKLVDIHSPNSGSRIDLTEGFDARLLTNNLFTAYEHRVYYHFSGLPKFVEIINKRLFPKSAPKFSLILRKL